MIFIYDIIIKMNAEQIYNRFKALGSAKTKEGRAFKSTLTESEFTAYKKYRDNQRQKKFEATHREENNKRRRLHIQQVREHSKAQHISKSILDDIIDAVPNLKLVDGEVKKKRGRKVGWRKQK